MNFELQPTRLQRVAANLKLLLARCFSEHAPRSTPSCPRCSASAPSLRFIPPSVHPSLRQSSKGPGARHLPASGTGSAGPAGMDGEQVGHVLSEEFNVFLVEGLVEASGGARRFFFFCGASSVSAPPGSCCWEGRHLQAEPCDVGGGLPAPVGRQFICVLFERAAEERSEIRCCLGVILRSDCWGRQTLLLGSARPQFTRPSHPWTHYFLCLCVYVCVQSDKRGKVMAGVIT